MPASTARQACPEVPAAETHPLRHKKPPPQETAMAINGSREDETALLICADLRPTRSISRRAGPFSWPVSWRCTNHQKIRGLGRRPLDAEDILHCAEDTEQCARITLYCLGGVVYSVGDNSHCIGPPFGHFISRWALAYYGPGRLCEGWGRGLWLHIALATLHIAAGRPTAEAHIRRGAHVSRTAQHRGTWILSIALVPLPRLAPALPLVFVVPSGVARSRPSGALTARRRGSVIRCGVIGTALVFLSFG